jgi:hypothetical protein
MTTQEIASRLAELCRTGDFKKAQEELFADDAVSIEQHATAAFEKETKGIKAIIKKGEVWNSMVEEVHNLSVSEPLVAASSFALILGMDVSMKEQGGRMNMNELCVYEVKDGKIISEQFHM